MITLTRTARMLPYGSAMNCYILVGGRSTRMGVSKSELFLERVVAAARPVFDEVLAVQRSGGPAVAIVPTVFEESHEDDGPIFGIVAALRHAKAPCFILAVDYPYITSDALRLLRDDGGVAHGQPLCAVWSPDQLAELERRIASGHRDLHGLWEEGMIDEAIGDALRNVNTPEDWDGR
jgi:molybdopterin-guanine dinucleotide biosynthesis protein A